MITRILPAAALTLSLGSAPASRSSAPSVTQPPSERPGLFLVNEQVEAARADPLPGCLRGRGVQRPHRHLHRALRSGFSRPGGAPGHAGPHLRPRHAEVHPRKPGRYHIFAAFEPVGGIHQFDALCRGNRSAEAALLHRCPRPCTSLERTQLGRPSCAAWSSSVDGGTVLQFSGGRLAVSGDVVWRVDCGGNRTLRGHGNGAQLTGPLTHTAGAAPRPSWPRRRSC